MSAGQLKQQKVSFTEHFFPTHARSVTTTHQIRRRQSFNCGDEDCFIPSSEVLKGPSENLFSQSPLAGISVKDLPALVRKTEKSRRSNVNTWGMASRSARYINTASASWKD